MEIQRIRDRGRAHRYREAAQVLNCSERHIIRLVRSGKLKADRLGDRVVRIFDDELDRFVASARNGERVAAYRNGGGRTLDDRGEACKPNAGSGS
jgi:excisionase family DNA binding protein